MSKIKELSTGAKRTTDADKTAYYLISPVGLRRVAETSQEGATKYAPYNWEKGMPVTEMLNHALGHIYKYLAGDRSEDHLGHAAWNLLGACHSEELWPELNKNLRGAGCVPPKVDREAVSDRTPDAAKSVGSRVDTLYIPPNQIPLPGFNPV